MQCGSEVMLCLIRGSEGCEEEFESQSNNELWRIPCRAADLSLLSKRGVQPQRGAPWHSPA